MSTPLPFAAQVRGIRDQWVTISVFRSEARAKAFCVAERAGDAQRGDITPWAYRVVKRLPKPYRKRLTPTVS